MISRWLSILLVFCLVRIGFFLHKNDTINSAGLVLFIVLTLVLGLVIDSMLKSKQTKKTLMLKRDRWFYLKTSRSEFFSKMILQRFAYYLANKDDDGRAKEFLYNEIRNASNWLNELKKSAPEKQCLDEVKNVLNFLKDQLRNHLPPEITEEQLSELYTIIDNKNLWRKQRSLC
jgi:hypothetical protein